MEGWRGWGGGEAPSTHRGARLENRFHPRKLEDWGPHGPITSQTQLGSGAMAPSAGPQMLTTHPSKHCSPGRAPHPTPMQMNSTLTTSHHLLQPSSASMPLTPLDWGGRWGPGVLPAQVARMHKLASTLLPRALPSSARPPLRPQEMWVEVGAMGPGAVPFPFDIAV